MAFASSQDARSPLPPAAPGDRVPPQLQCLPRVVRLALVPQIVVKRLGPRVAVEHVQRDEGEPVGCCPLLDAGHGCARIDSRGHDGHAAFGRCFASAILPA